jgi:Fur family transcriptional regulator, ferric uptake regulator
MDWAEHANESLSHAGYRAGGARRAVIELLARRDCVVSAQDVFDALRAEDRPVGIASVYRVLDVLSELHLVQRLDVGGGGARYERVMPDGSHHHHLVCDACGRVEPFSDVPLEEALERLGSRVPYTVATHDVVLRGACDDCRTAA